MLSRLIGLLIALPFLYGAAVLAALSWGGEVVEIQTYDWRGASSLTSLWIVDLYGGSWLRALDPDAAWVQRIEAHPEVVLIRDGKDLRRKATIVDDFGERINAGMREKYGIADVLLAPFYDAAEVLAVRLDEP